MVHVVGKFFDFLAFGFLALKREANFSGKNVKMKLTLLKKVSKVVPFTDFFPCGYSVYSQ